MARRARWSGRGRAAGTAMFGNAHSAQEERMNTRAWMIGVAVVVLGCAARPAAAQLAPALQYVMENNLASFNRKDLNATMSTIHTKSPDYESTKAALTSQFTDPDVSAALVDFTYIGHDDELAVGGAKLTRSGR